MTVSEAHPNRSVTILVAIADVDELVKKESALDAHAQHNTTSVYTAGEIFPMLPEKLSTDLTSLGEGQDSLRDRRRDGGCGGRSGSQFDPLSGHGPQPCEAGL